MASSEYFTKRSGIWAPIFSTRPWEMIPVGAKGEKAAELEAPTTMRVMQKADIPTWPAMAMVMGARRATPAMLPGPIVVMKMVRK